MADTPMIDAEDVESNAPRDASQALVQDSQQALVQDNQQALVQDNQQSRASKFKAKLANISPVKLQTSGLPVASRPNEPKPEEVIGVRPDLDTFPSSLAETIFQSQRRPAFTFFQDVKAYLLQIRNKPEQRAGVMKNVMKFVAYFVFYFCTSQANLPADISDMDKTWKWMDNLLQGNRTHRLKLQAFVPRWNPKWDETYGLGSVGVPGAPVVEKVKIPPHLLKELVMDLNRVLEWDLEDKDLGGLGGVGSLGSSDVSLAVSKDTSENESEGREEKEKEKERRLEFGPSSRAMTLSGDANQEGESTGTVCNEDILPEETRGLMPRPTLLDEVEEETEELIWRALRRQRGLQQNALINETWENVFGPPYLKAVGWRMSSEPVPPTDTEDADSQPPFSVRQLEKCSGLHIGDPNTQKPASPPRESDASAAGPTSPKVLPQSPTLRTPPLTSTADQRSSDADDEHQTDDDEHQTDDVEHHADDDERHADDDEHHAEDSGCSFDISIGDTVPLSEDCFSLFFQRPKRPTIVPVDEASPEQLPVAELKLEEDEDTESADDKHENGDVNGTEK
ncbi:hypothetical protein QBC47DRAFT_362458 [Echria macrotheca]|uniref:Uncharacterized protein n=1 Tax=Echria macrotheca TaxID=438768 RepID=A0AAJ0F9X2_9PEZI|nr:hypothetical protein QBC47DRAFT_362458 [Echria macrotheca]